MASLETALIAELAKNPDIGLHLFANQSIVDAKVADVMIDAQHPGLTKTAFVTLEATVGS